MSGIRSRMEQFSSEEIHLDTGWPLHLFFERTIYIDRDLEPMAAAIVRRTLDIIVEEEQEEERSYQHKGRISGLLLYNKGNLNA